MRCRVCGCGDESACVLVSRDGLGVGEAEVIATCRWVEEDLCSACAGELVWVRPARRVAEPAIDFERGVAALRAVRRLEEAA